MRIAELLYVIRLCAGQQCDAVALPIGIKGNGSTGSTRRRHTRILEYVYFSHGITTCAHNYAQFTSRCMSCELFTVSHLCAPLWYYCMIIMIWLFLFSYLFIQFVLLPSACLPACLRACVRAYVHTCRPGNPAIVHTYTTQLWCEDDFMIWHCLGLSQTNKKKQARARVPTHIRPMERRSQNEEKEM